MQCVSPRRGIYREKEQYFSFSSMFLIEAEKREERDSREQEGGRRERVPGGVCV